MKDILAEEHRDVLAQVACSNTLLGFDYDGTLAPIVRDPHEARLRRETRDLLEQVAAAYPCVVLSGRAQHDALRRLRGSGVFEVIGNHGLEPWRRTDAYAARVRDWAAALDGRLSRVAGITVEDKVFSIAVHYRQARPRAAARRLILDAVAALDEVRVVGGKCVVNLIPRGAPHKGLALEAARQLLRCDMALYVGDDDTDEAVFAMDEPGRLITVRVGADPTSRAGFFIRGQRQIDVLLAELVRLRREGDGPRPGRTGRA